MPRQATPLRRTPMPRSSGPVKPRRQARQSGEVWARQVVRARSGGVCELGMCGGSPAWEWSHRVRRSQGGRWEATNGLDACHDCHALITTHPWECDAEGRGWAIRSTADPARTPVWRRGEWVWLLPDGWVVALSPAEVLALRGDAA